MWPTSTIIPLSTATSATRRGRPDPSMTVPPRNMRSTMDNSLGRDCVGGEEPARAMDASEQVLVHAVAGLSGGQVEATEGLVQDRVAPSCLRVAEVVDDPLDR